MRKTKFWLPGDVVHSKRDVRVFVTVMVLIVLAIAALTYWPS